MIVGFLKNTPQVTQSIEQIKHALSIILSVDDRAECIAYPVSWQVRSAANVRHWMDVIAAQLLILLIAS